MEPKAIVINQSLYRDTYLCSYSKAEHHWPHRVFEHVTDLFNVHESEYRTDSTHSNNT